MQYKPACGNRSFAFRYNKRPSGETRWHCTLSQGHQREEEILQQLSKGYSTKEIADRASVSVNTVRSHLQHIYEKLHVRSRTEAVLKYLQ